jgi:hypothetical protein
MLRGRLVSDVAGGAGGFGLAAKLHVKDATLAESQPRSHYEYLRTHLW